MDRHSNTVQNENGRAIAGASVLILDASSGLPATIYTNRQGTPAGNPLTTDALGQFSFCAADGLYRGEVRIGGVLKAVIEDIRLEDPSDGFASLQAEGGAAMVGTAGGSTVQAELDGLRTDVDAMEPYVLPAATDTVRGGVRIGSGLTITGDLLSAPVYSLPVATESVLGGVKAGSGVSIAGDGTLTFTQYSLPIAGASTLGGVKVGSGLAIDAGGVLSATGGSSGTVSSVNSVAPDGGGNVSLTTDNLPESGAPTNQWFTASRVRSVVLTGLSTATNAAIVAADTILAALGKLQAQISANTTAISGKQDTSGKDASGGYAGLTGFALNLKNAAGSVLSTIASAATVARTYTFPDKDGTVAMLSDIASSGALTQYVQTANQTITTAGGLTIGHGLTAAPKVLLGFLKCINANVGYAVGDELPIAMMNDVVNSRGAVVTSDATNIYIRFGNQSNVFTILNKTTGTSATVLNADWRFFVRAFA